MSNRPTSTLIEQAEAAGLVLFSGATPLPKDGSAPEWITLFPRTGQVETRDGRAFDVSAATLMAAFEADDIYIPVDINHATDAAGMFGGRADAVGWGTELREHDGGLQIKVDWLAEGRELLAARKYLYTSPSFYQQANRATRLKAVALVTSPALARQPALANAGPLQEPSIMKSIAQALGLAEAANEAECLTALATMKAGTVAKAIHDEAIAKLSAVTTELASLKAAARAEKVSTLLESALKGRKILPPQKDAYLAMCSTDDGLANVEKLLAVTVPAMPGSGLDARDLPVGGDAADPATLAAAAQKIEDERRAAGMPISFAEAVTLAGKKATAA